MALDKRPKRKCEYVTDIITIEDFYQIAIENNHSLINVKKERKDSSKKHKMHYVSFTIKGPEDWEMKEQVEMACNHRSHSNEPETSPSRVRDGLVMDKVSIEYLLLPSYSKMYNQLVKFSIIRVAAQNFFCE